MSGNGTITVGRFAVTTCRQGGCHPWADRTAVTEGQRHRKYLRSRSWTGWAIRPSLRSRSNRRGGAALVVGWERDPAPKTPRGLRKDGLTDDQRARFDAAAERALAERRRQLSDRAVQA